jgi:soluble lytic murein transglycosylase
MRMLMRKIFLSVIMIAALGAADRALAAVYYWVDENGVYHFTNTPPARPQTVRPDPDVKRLDIWGDGGGDPTIIYLDPYYSVIINDACRYYKVDPVLVKAMIKVESNFNRNAVSRAGAQGLMQLMPATARRFNVNDPFHPVENIWAGVYFVKYLMVKYNYNYDLVLAGYNAGEGAVKKYGGVPPYRETRNYVKKVKYYWALYKKKEPRFQARKPVRR